VGELRKDYILDRWVIIATGRGKRPIEFKQQAQPTLAPDDAFAPGHEDQTPPEIGRVSTREGWKMRWFENKFAAVQPQGVAEPRTDNDFFTFAANFGFHEVIVETPDARQLWDLDVDDIEGLFGVYRHVIAELKAKPGIKYVQVFKNSGAAAGTSIIHSHTQVIALPIMPAHVREEVAAVRRFVNDPWERIITIEKGSLRRVFENDGAVAFCPYASRFNYECWIFPKDFARNLEEADIHALADALQHVLSRLKLLGCAYNYVLHYAPDDADMRMHIEILPRIATWAGFELGTDVIINTVSPEDAAAFYRGEQ
jgi:UDPglucose--hexose-1-phosphate uridylyltransferase